jgi:hypothetical protein
MVFVKILVANGGASPFGYLLKLKLTIAALGLGEVVPALASRAAHTQLLACRRVGVRYHFAGGETDSSGQFQKIARIPYFLRKG